MSRRAWRLEVIYLFILFLNKKYYIIFLCDAAWVVRPGETASSADLGGSSKYSNENFED